MKRLTFILLIIATMSACKQDEKIIITRSDIQLQSDTLTPEALWAMGRIGAYSVSPDGQRAAYQVTYYSVKENRSNSVIYAQALNDSVPVFLGPGSDPVWLSDAKIAYADKGEVWSINHKGNSRTQLTKTNGAVQGFLFSPDQKRMVIIKSVPFNDIIQARPADLPKSTGLVITDLMYRHWDHYVESIPHPFVLDLKSGKDFDILEGQPFECPAEPFGGVEQIAWSPDSKHIAFTCRTKTGLAYSISTDTDIYLYDVDARDTKAAQNLCKPGLNFEQSVAAASATDVNPTKALRNQAVNEPDNVATNNPGYDQNPKFSPDGRYVAWLSMARDGYEADRQRLCIYDLQTGTKNYATESFDSNVDDFIWGADSNTLYFIGVWHATENLYRTDLQGNVAQLTGLQADWGALQLIPSADTADHGKPAPIRLLMERHDFFHPADLYIVSVPGDTASSAQSTPVEMTQLTHENDHILSQLAPGCSEARWCSTTDGQQLHYWVIKPPHFDPTKKYPTLLFCEGGPQSPVSQFWSYRWNFYIMASQGYVIIAPNRRGLPGFGQEWLEEISGDWTGQCMQDYLSAIDDTCDSLPYVDRDRLGAVGASFGGFSVYYLAGHHDKRFKCFISHDGAFNLEAMYTETEENWFSNWEYDDAYWNKDRTANADRTYSNSPHLFVDQWDTPILCIHGEKDYRINATQGMSAFNAARMRGIEAELLLYPDENPWVLHPQNGILWQRTYFEWLDRWLKK
ncbi:MAG: S9 family peptidase [Bacteroidales bacterium]|nr:S9 family peptidase [Bacteroidales bacterium]